jgi:hypothetical protein
MKAQPTLRIIACTACTDRLRARGTRGIFQCNPYAREMLEHRAGRPPATEGGRTRKTEKTFDQLRAEAEALLKHADSLEKWGRERLVVALDEVWNKPDPNVVTLQDGRKVARQYYDPAIHGPASSS